MHHNKNIEYFNSLFRKPQEIIGGSILDSKILNSALQFKADESFVELLDALDLNLVISREYEHLALSYHVENHQLVQSYHVLPHPSGIAFHPDGRLFIASTRNPNQIYEFGIQKDYFIRSDNSDKLEGNNILTPTRTKFFPGHYYFHDLVFIGDKLYANSVGNNGVVAIDMDSQQTDPLSWQVETTNKEKLSLANHLQVNSIAAGNSLEKSFFTASTKSVSSIRPGHKNFKVDQQGVVFNFNSEIVATGLTRPHSARLCNKQIFLDNSGYGSFGSIQNNQFEPLIHLPGWTRGLFIHQDIAFIGSSKVLPNFEHYAPGLDPKKCKSAIYAFDLKKMKLLGSIQFPHGNQIFGIEGQSAKTSKGFLLRNTRNNQNKIKSYYYKYKI